MGEVGGVPWPGPFLAVLGHIWQLQEALLGPGRVSGDADWPLNCRMLANRGKRSETNNTLQRRPLELDGRDEMDLDLSWERSFFYRQNLAGFPKHS